MKQKTLSLPHKSPFKNKQTPPSHTQKHHYKHLQKTTKQTIVN